jgi:thioredoxin-related protein
LLIAGLWAFALIVAPAEGAELVMFEALSCEWCEVWDEEVGVVYHKTVEGRLAPLRRISIHETRPADLRPIAGVRYSPTFVLIDGGHEVGRIVGYPGEDHFWGLLQVLLDDLP